jgi:hypothetical protein
VHARPKSQAFHRKSPEPCKLRYLKLRETHALLRDSEFFTDDSSSVVSIDAPVSNLLTMEPIDSEFNQLCNCNASQKVIEHRLMIDIECMTSYYDNFNIFFE